MIGKFDMAALRARLDDLETRLAKTLGSLASHGDLPPSHQQEVAEIRAKHTALDAKLTATGDSTWKAVEHDLEADWSILSTAFERWAAHVDQDFEQKK